MNRLFNKHIDNDAPQVRGQKILVAVSGGCDSVLLTHLLQRNHFEIVLAHANFQLRGDESERDQEFVSQLAEERKLTLEIEKFAIKSKSGVQEKARQIRYQWFEEVAKKHHCAFIATGHHADDNTETFLMQLIRGAGPEGLSGMSILENKIFRPLLPFSRAEIETEALRLGLKWVTDSSNLSSKYTRNRLRNEILPGLRQLNPALNDTVQRTMTLMRENQLMVQKLVPQFITKSDSGLSEIDVRVLRETGFPLSILHHWLNPYGFSVGQIREALKLTEAETGKKITSGDYQVIRNRELLLLVRTSPAPTEITVSSPECSVIFGSFKFTLSKSEPSEFDEASSVCFDPVKAPFPWTVRTWKKGDRIKSTGIKGSKKLSDLFVQHKIPLHQKDLIPVWECAGEIMWVSGLAISRNFLSTGISHNHIKISMDNFKS